MLSCLRTLTLCSHHERCRCWINVATATERRSASTIISLRYFLHQQLPHWVYYLTTSQFTVWLDHRMIFSIDVNGAKHSLKLGLEDDPVVVAEVRLAQAQLKECTHLLYFNNDNILKFQHRMKSVPASKCCQGGLPYICTQRALCWVL